MVAFGSVAVVHRGSANRRGRPRRGAHGDPRCRPRRGASGHHPERQGVLWKPNAGDYCAGLGELSTPLGQNALYISTVANAAPTAASRSAVLAYYHDFTHDLTPSTGADITRI